MFTLQTLAPEQMPPWHVSVGVQTLESSQEVPFGFAGAVHAPVLGRQTPAVWHWSWAVQITGFFPVQVPPWQVSVCVHPLPSLQAVSSAFAGFEHAPVPVLHVPTSWQESCAEHTTGFAPRHVPVWQVSTWVHALLSLHAVLSATAGLEQTPFAGLHAPGE